MSKQDAYNTLKLASVAAAAAYDVALDIAGNDREAVYAATARYEVALAAARRAYNDVMFPGVFS